MLRFFFEETNVKAEVGDNNQSSASKGIFRKYGLASFRVLAKQRPGWIRLCLALTLCAMLVEQIYVDNTFLFLLVKQPPFSFTAKTFARLDLATYLFGGAGAVGLPVALRFIKLPGKESIAAIVAAVSSGLVCMFIAFANATWQLFAASSLFLPAGVFGPASHTIVAKIVDSDEMGALFALKSMLLLGFSLVEKFILSKIYAATVDWWPGFIFAISGGIVAVVCAGLIFSLQIDNQLHQFVRMSDSDEAKKATTTAKMVVEGAGGAVAAGAGLAAAPALAGAGLLAAGAGLLAASANSATELIERCDGTKK
ncbi:Protein F40F9.5 [Aphelenchoides avenae]|nr:Protein F40F9.5 [Aphelenchus avenae]